MDKRGLPNHPKKQKHRKNDKNIQTTSQLINQIIQRTKELYYFFHKDCWEVNEQKGTIGVISREDLLDQIQEKFKPFFIHVRLVNQDIERMNKTYKEKDMIPIPTVDIKLVLKQVLQFLVTHNQVSGITTQDFRDRIVYVNKEEKQRRYAKKLNISTKRSPFLQADGKTPIIQDPTLFELSKLCCFLKVLLGDTYEAFMAEIERAWMLAYFDEFPSLKIRYIALVGKAGQGKTLLSELLKMLFGVMADIIYYAIGETHFANAIESYVRLIDDPKNIEKYGSKNYRPR